MMQTQRRDDSPNADAAAGTPLIGFYGDDFTGSTDALAQLARFGLRGILLLQTPASDRPDSRSHGFDVVGIAGISRALPTARMEAEVRPALAALARLSPRVIQYKICSTFDSSPGVGSIGRIIELGTEMFGDTPIPVVPAQPHFGRYTVFGNHFARHRHIVYRLDRHPTMSRHPSTPMDEADLCRILAEQTRMNIGLLSLLELKNLCSEGQEDLGPLAPGIAGAVVIDALTNTDLVLAAKLILKSDGRPSPRFVIGSGGLSYGLGRSLTSGEEVVRPPLKTLKQIVAVSGSCSSQTGRQIAYAVSHGWTAIHIDPARLLDPAAEGDALREVTERVLAALRSGGSVVVHTAGEESPATSVVNEGSPMSPLELVHRIGNLFGDLLDSLLRGTSIRRVIVAGGDTSGFTVRRLDAYGLEAQAPLAEAGSVCRLRSDVSHLDGVQLVLKGGQVGDDDFFEVVQRGSGSR